MFRQDIRLPFYLLYSEPEEQICETTTEYASKICKKMDQTHDFVRQQMKVEGGREKWNYDNRVETCIYNPGDSVWIHNSKWRKAIFPKLQHTWGGPYLVVKRLSDEVYQIQKLKGFKPKVVHFSCA
mgnify:CR=1 FL=1